MNNTKFSLTTAADDCHHAVALFEALSSGAAGYNFAGQLKPWDVGGRACRSRVGAAELQLIGSVQASSTNCDHYLAGASNGIGALLDDELLILDCDGEHCRSLSQR
jgi:hypothetical protein